MSETQLSRSIQLALRKLGVWCIRVQAGIHRVRGGTLHCAERGTPDLCLPGLGWLEIKTDEGELSDDQVAWHIRAARLGVNVAVVRSVEQAVYVAQEWEEQKQKACFLSSRSNDAPSER